MRRQRVPGTHARVSGTTVPRRELLPAALVSALLLAVASCRTPEGTGTGNDDGREGEVARDAIEEPVAPLTEEAVGASADEETPPPRGAEVHADGDGETIASASLEDAILRETRLRKAEATARAATARMETGGARSRLRGDLLDDLLSVLEDGSSERAPSAAQEEPDTTPRDGLPDAASLRELLADASGAPGASDASGATGAPPGGEASSDDPASPAPPLRSPPASPPQEEDAGAAEAAPPAGDAVEGVAPASERPPGRIVLKQMHHKTSDEVMHFLRESFPGWIERGHVAKVAGKGRSVMIFGETPEETDPLTLKIESVLDEFDLLELKIQERVIRPKYIDVHLAMDALVMRGLANVWQRASEEIKATEQLDPKTQKTSVYNREVYTPTGLTMGAEPPLPIKPRVPYVYDMPVSDPFLMPLIYTGNTTGADTEIVQFDRTSSTERRGAMVAVGTPEDLEQIEAFVRELDQPAPRIMIEVQVIGLEASKLIDLGIDSAQFGQRHTLGGVALPLPGEPIQQPGFGDDARRDPDTFVPPLTQEGFQVIFDDTSFDLSGRFITNLHALVREGEAKVMARPKILTLDDRVSVLHLGQEVPTFKSTGVTRDATDGNLVSEVNEVATVYVGFTLNLRPKVTGGDEDEVSLLIEVIVNELGERSRVFEEDLLGIPTIIKRSYVGQNRVRNHRPIVLGGLIQEQEVESVNKIPILGDIPGLKWFFSRTLKSSERTEIILVVTPHILSDSSVDRIATPKESPIFDTFDSVLFNDRHVIKGKDVLGLDPITGQPAEFDGRLFSESEVVDLTLLKIIKERRLVSKLRIFDDYLSDASSELNWYHRRWPERTVSRWDEDKKQVYFRAAAIVLENIKELNPDLTFEELVMPRREIILPTTPYRISLGEKKAEKLQELAKETLFRAGGRVELGDETVDLLRDLADRSLADFGHYLGKIERKAEDHGELLMELKRLYLGQYPTDQSLDGIPYPEVWTTLARARVDFFSLATYFKENLERRYVDRGRPNIGMFEVDLVGFANTAVSLYQRARDLKELQDKWEKLMQPPPETADVYPPPDGADEGRR